MHVVITGASKGIGRDLAIKFSGMKNTRLYLIARTSSLLEELKDECHNQYPDAIITLLPFDLNLLNDKKPKLPDSLNHIDILINNAGLLVNKSFDKLTQEDIQGMVNVNYLAPLNLIQYFLPKMGGSLPTHVVNISSMGGFQGSTKFPGLSVYSSTKAALASLTECLATEFAGTGSYFNCLALGSVQTEMLSEAFPGYQAPLNPAQIAEFIVDFAIKGYRFMNGKILPVSLNTP